MPSSLRLGRPLLSWMAAVLLGCCLMLRWRSRSKVSSAAPVITAPIVCSTFTAGRRRLLEERGEETRKPFFPRYDVAEEAEADVIHSAAAEQRRQLAGGSPPPKVTALNLQAEDASHIWLPIGVEEEGFEKGDPWIRMCLIDYGAYAVKPDEIPMYESLVRISHCTSSSASSVLIRLEDAVAQTTAACGSVAPSGFVFHETRCGSTLVANMLASVPSNRVYSEARPPVQVIRMAEKLGMAHDSASVSRMFRGLMSLMGRRRASESHHRLFFKLQNAKFAPIITNYYPDVPFIFVFRDPVEVMVSNVGRGNPGGAPCVRDEMQAKGPKAFWGEGRTIKAKLNTAVAEACSTWLRMLCDRAIAAAEAHPGKGAFVEYPQLPEAFYEHLYPEHFGLLDSDKAIDWESRMRENSVAYSKGFGSKKGTVFKNDTEAKHEMADPALQVAADARLYDVFHQLQAMQSYKRPTRRRRRLSALAA